MKIIFISDDGSSHRKFNLPLKLKFVMPLVFFLSVSIVLLGGYFYRVASQPTLNHVNGQNNEINPAITTKLAELGKLRLQVDRLNTLGNFIARQENIDIEQFMLKAEPGVGGLNQAHPARLYDASFLSKDINDLEKDIAQQEKQYQHLKQMLELKYLESQAINLYVDKNNNIELISDFTKPVPTGYVSSRFGPRRDPINGKHRNHNGVDLAAPTGTEVQTIASGFVSFVGRKGGYGNVIEIQHSHSLKSRYAHLNAFNVSVGDVVRKGIKIGEVGSTGRVTGPHLHLEVWRNQKPVDPLSYLEGFNVIEK